MDVCEYSKDSFSTILFDAVTTSLTNTAKGLPRGALYKRIVVNQFPYSLLVGLNSLASSYWAGMNWGDDAQLTYDPMSSTWSFTDLGPGGGGGGWGSWWVWTEFPNAGPGSHDPVNGNIMAVLTRFYFVRSIHLKIWTVTLGNSDSASNEPPASNNGIDWPIEAGTVTVGTDLTLFLNLTTSGDFNIDCPETTSPGGGVTPADTTDAQQYAAGWGGVGVINFLDLTT